MISRIADINNGFLKYAAYRTYIEKTRLIILCVCGVLGFPMLGLAAVLMVAAQRSRNISHAPGIELFSGISVVLTVVACAVMAIIAYSGGIINFEYFNRREKVDMSWSLPVKTRDRFWGDFVSGIVPVAVIYSVSGLIGFAIVALGTRNSFDTPGEYSVTMAMILTALIIGLLFLISLYIISVFCAALCGRVFEAAIYPALICGIIPSLIALVGIMVFNGAWQIDIMAQLVTVLRCSSPFGFLIGGLDEATYSTFRAFDIKLNSAGEYLLENAIFLKPAVIIPFIIIHGGFLTGAYFLGKNRKAESTGQAFVFKWASEIVITLVMFCIVALFSYGVAQDITLSGGLIFGLIVTTAIAFLFLDITVKRRFVRMGRAFFRYAVMVTGSVLVSSLILTADGFGLGEYVPPADRIESVKVSIAHAYEHDRIDWWGTGNSYDRRTEFTERESIEILRNVHIKSNRAGTSRRWQHYYRQQFTYTLTNGKEVRRYVNIAVDGAALMPLYATREYKESRITHIERMRNETATMISVSMTNLTGETELFNSGTNSFIDPNKIYDALMLDYISETFEQRYLSTGRNYGTISCHIEFISKDLDRFYKGSANISMVVRPHFVNLIRELERQGLQTYAEPDFEFYRPEIQIWRGHINATSSDRWEWQNTRHIWLTEENEELITKLFEVGQPAYLINGQGFSIHTWAGMGLDLIIPPQYEDLIKELWDMAYSDSYKYHYEDDDYFHGYNPRPIYPVEGEERAAASIII